MSRAESVSGAVSMPSNGAKGPVAFAALQHRDFLPYILTTILANIGDNIEHVISYWVMFEAFHSALLGGLAVITHWTPFLVFSVYFGALSDRFDCRKIIQLSQVLLIGASVAWGLLFATGSLQVWHAIAILLVHGIAGALATPASQLMIHDMVGPQHLQSAVRLSATGRQISLFLGPGVGGLLMLLLGPAIGLLVNVLFYLPLTVWLLVMPRVGHRQEDGRPVGAGTIRFREALDVLPAVVGNRPIIAMVAMAGSSSLLIGNAFLAQMPEFARDLGADEKGVAYSALMAANAAGALLGGLLLEGTGILPVRVRTAIVCAGLWALAIGGFAAAPTYPLALALLFLAGGLNLAAASMAQTVVQLLAPASVRGGVVGLLNSAQFGLRIGSGVTVGVLGSVIGIHWSLGLSAAMLLVISIGLLLFARSGKEDLRLGEA